MYSVIAFMVSSVGDALLVVDGEFGGARLEELAAVAEVHVDELRGEVPAGLVGSSQRILHDALLLDHLGGGQDLLIGLGYTSLTWR